MAPVLPIEVFYSIIPQVVAIKDFLSLSLCCSEFRQETQRLLFRHPITQTHEELMLFTLAICSAPSRLGPLVHKYTMMYYPGPDADSAQDAAFISRSLSAMCNLKQVEHCASLLMPLNIYKNCKAPLQSINYYGDLKATPEISSLVYDVLLTRVSLTDIVIDFWDTIRISAKLMKAAADLCPNLISLSVRDGAIGEMLLQRKKHLQSLKWMVGTSTPISMTVSQYEHLNYLNMWIFARGLNISFAQHLSSLVLLELRFEPGWDSNILVVETQFIAHIPHLQYLTIYQGFLEIPRSIAAGQQILCPEFALSAFRMRNTLKHIDIGRIRDRRGPRVYLRVFARLNEVDMIQRCLVSATEVDAIRNKYSLS